MKQGFKVKRACWQDGNYDRYDADRNTFVHHTSYPNLDATPDTENDNTVYTAVSLLAEDWELVKPVAKVYAHQFTITPFADGWNVLYKEYNAEDDCTEKYSAHYGHRDRLVNRVLDNDARQCDLVALKSSVIALGIHHVDFNV